MIDFDYDPCPVVCYERFSWPRLYVKLLIAYAVIAFFCWEEVRYRSGGVEVTADVQAVGNDHKGRTQIRYTFRDPQTGAQRRNTVALPESQRPAGRTATVQCIPGELSSSRLKSQARPSAIAVFATINAVLLLATAGLIGYWAREANRRPLTRQQRAVAEYRRKQKQRA